MRGLIRALWRACGGGVVALAMAAATAMVAAPAVLIVTAALSLLLPETKILAAKEAFPPLPESLTFIDRFRTLDDSRWHFSDGWNNGMWMENDWRREALSITPNGLAITMRPNPPGPGRRPFMSGELQSRELYLYGYFEASMRIPNGPGIVSALFTYVKPYDNSTWEEIDVEFMGARPRLMELTYHVHGFSKQETINLGFDPSQNFNIYGFEWTPTALRWYVNNQLVQEVTDARVQRLRRPQRYYLSLWGTTELWRWAEALNPADAPWVMEVSCVARAERYEGRSICARPAP